MGPTTDTGLPTSVLGLPVYTVAGINQRVADGKLDGRFAVVAGYWVQEALPCAFMPHVSPVLGFCNGGRFGDTAAQAQSGGSGTAAPIAVPETVGADLLWQMAGRANDPARVALIVHAADARSWQCAPADRATCTANLVIDRVAWINDQEVATMLPDTTDVQGEDLHLGVDEVIAAGLQPGETPVLVKPLHAGEINDVDPRFIGKATGIAWYMRVISGTPNGDGIVSGRDVLVDATGAVVSSLPLETGPEYQPARLVLDQNGYSGSGAAAPRYEVSVDGRVVANDWLDSSSTPLALDVGAYDVRAYLGTETTDLGDTFSCEQPVTLAGDVAYYADYANGGCIWKMGEWPFN